MNTARLHLYHERMKIRFKVCALANQTTGVQFFPIATRFKLLAGTWYTTLSFHRSKLANSRQLAPKHQIKEFLSILNYKFNSTIYFHTTKGTECQKAWIMFAQHCYVLVNTLSLHFTGGYHMHSYPHNWL
jgi:hypothetical protein